MNTLSETRTRPGLLASIVRRRTAAKRIAVVMASVLLFSGSVVVLADHPPKSTFALLPEPRPIPVVEFIDAEGTTRTLEEFHGRTVLLNLWATWCPPCREEMPALDRLQQSLGGDDFVVIALSIDGDGLPAVEQFFSDIGIEHLAIYTDPWGDSSGALRAVALPTTLLIDRQGREIGRRAGPAEWDGHAVIAEICHYLDDGRTGSQCAKSSTANLNRRP